MIRYDKKINQEINRTIKNFNQKIERLDKLNKELLPEKITKKQLKASVKDRTELRRKLKELQRFGQRGIEEVVTTEGGVQTTKYEIQNLKKESARIKQKITREINTLKVEKPRVFGKQQARTFAEMGDEYYLNLIARRQALDKEISKLSKEEFRRYSELLERTNENIRKTNEKFKSNYWEMLTDLAYLYGYDTNKLKELENKIMGLRTDKFLKLFREDKSIKAIVEYYALRVSNAIGINPDDIAEDVFNLYDNLYENIDEIIKDYA